MNRTPNQQRGLTLVELMLSVAIIGVLMTVISPMISSALQFIEASNRKEATLNNQKLAQAVLRYASSTVDGKLPAQPTTRTYGVIDSASPDELELEVQNSGVPMQAVNTTGTGVNHVKVYRVVSGLEHELPLYFNTGAKVTLKYDVGVIYQTVCPSSSGCASNATPKGDIVVTGNTGTTPAFTQATLDSWQTEGEDYGAVMFNTLNLQKDRLRVTIGRLNRLTDRLSSYYYAKARADSYTNTNFFPAGGASAGTGQNCMTHWVNLKNSDVLKEIGLDGEEFGTTAWGADIQYCRDYRATGVASTDSPFFAALRIHKNLSDNLSPALPADNAVITF